MATPSIHRQFASPSWMRGRSPLSRTLMTISVALVPVLFAWVRSATTTQTLRDKDDDHDESESTKTKKKKKALMLPPYPPNVGMWETLRCLCSSDLPWFFLRSFRSLDGCPVFRIKLPLPVTGIVIADPILTRDIYVDPTTTRPLDFYGAFEKLTIKPALGSKGGHEWKAARKTISPAFSSRRIRQMNAVCSAHIDEWIQTTLEPLAAAGLSVNVGEEMIRITLRVISESAFQYKISDEEIKLFQHELELCLDEYLHKQLVNPFRALKFWDPELRRAGQAAINLQKLALKIIANYRNRNQSTSTHYDDDERTSLISLIMNSSIYKNDEERAAEVVSFLIVGHDTTGYSIAWCLLELAKNPKECDKLRAALLGIPNAEDRIQCPALHYVIREAGRIHPVAADGGARTVGRDYEYCHTIQQEGGDEKTIDCWYRIPKGSMIFPSQIVINHNEAVYENPEVFDPSRWENISSTTNERTKVASVITPFAYGPNNCIGQRLATAELNSVIAKLVTNYSFEVEEEGKPEFKLTLKPSGTRLIARKL